MAASTWPLSREICVYFDWRWVPPELQHLLGAEILLVAILVVAVCWWGARSWRQTKFSQRAADRSSRPR
ncbi:hypothetical protein, partial [Salmonella enterica]|uniref:hypothetical protein n=1 Tax=Salmonella enterica TaxID=28901 RepID=UPI003F1BB4D4